MVEPEAFFEPCNCTFGDSATKAVMDIDPDRRHIVTFDVGDECKVAIGTVDVVDRKLFEVASFLSSHDESQCSCIFAITQDHGCFANIGVCAIFCLAPPCELVSSQGCYCFFDPRGL